VDTTLAAAAVLAGARSIAAIAEWAADAPQPVRAALGARRDAPSHFAFPADATIRWTLSRLDADVLAPRSARGWSTGTGSGSGPDPQPADGGRSPSTARPCAAPAGQAPTAARRTCMDHATARCWPNARSAVP
jgi:hypothetical protein